jgi:hypothetical protein
MSKIYVVDTSYLLELYKVPGSSSAVLYEPVKERIARAIKDKAMLFIPLPCVIEFASHLADAADKQTALSIARAFKVELALSLENKGVWRVTPCYDSPRAFHDGFGTFISDHLLAGVGLCDSFTIAEATRLAEKYESFGYRVHVLTLDEALKAHEPHTEEDPFVGL